MQTRKQGGARAQSPRTTAPEATLATKPAPQSELVVRCRFRCPYTDTTGRQYEAGAVVALSGAEAKALASYGIIEPVVHEHAE